MMIILKNWNELKSHFVGGIHDGKDVNMDPYCDIYEVPVGNERLGAVQKEYYNRVETDFVLYHTELLH